MPLPTVIGVAPYNVSPVTLGDNDTHHFYMTPKVYSTGVATLSIGYKVDGAVKKTVNWMPGDTDIAPIQWVGQLVFTFTGTIQVNLQ